jgi:nucleoside 2-deoxyribosyltransferase
MAWRESLNRGKGGLLLPERSDILRAAMATTAPKRIYLCGPVMDEADGKAREWREHVKRKLGEDFILLDPMRRNFKDREVDSANEIVEFDLQDVRDADLILVNYSKPSIGTAMEVFYASHNLGKFVIAFTPFSFKDSSPWMVKFCTKLLPSLDEAIAYIREHFVRQDCRRSRRR